MRVHALPCELPAADASSDSTPAGRLPLTAASTRKLSSTARKTITVESWRAKAFPVVKDLVVDRSALDKIIQAGGYITAPTGTAPDAHSIPVPKPDADFAFQAAECTGCGACVAACPNGSAMLFTAAKVTHLGLLPQGQPERYSRIAGMLETHDKLGFGGRTNTGECTAACPKEIPQDVIGRLNKDFLHAVAKNR